MSGQAGSESDESTIWSNPSTNASTESVSHARVPGGQISDEPGKTTPVRNEARATESPSLAAGTDRWGRSLAL